MAPPAPSDDLRQLARLAGILPDYRDNDGVLRATAAETTRALLHALGHELSSDEAAARVLADERRSRAARWLAPVVVVQAVAAEGSPGRRPTRGALLRLPLPRSCAGQRAEMLLTLHWEDGSRSELARRRTLPASGRTFGVSLPPGPGPGYHRLQATLRCAGRECTAEQQLLLHPGRCVWPLADGERLFGLWANLSTLRSESNWGRGDFSDLARLATFGGSLGAAFTGINPLHALPDDVAAASPYSPLSRLFGQPLFLDIEAIPEWNRELVARQHPELDSAVADARQRPALDDRALWALRRPVLETLHGTFVTRHGGGDTPRGRDYRAYLERHGRVLDDFATFMALRERHDPAPGRRRDWRDWPAPLRDPRSQAVAAFRRQHHALVDFHRWLQFECKCQLSRAQATARETGQRLGLYHDLAIGTPAWGADPWAWPGLFVSGASIGCPPDAFAPEGQDWDLAPLSPRALEQGGWRYWRAVLRAAMAHGGMVRIDHVMGLFRQYWIPAGTSARDGAYVTYPWRVLAAVLAIESQRHGVAVVGEDLGTVTRGLASRLSRRGILSSRVALFERDRLGSFRPAAAFSRRALLTWSTHDLPPLAALRGDDDILLRRRVGQLADGEALERARIERLALLRALLLRLVREGLLPPETLPPSRPPPPGPVTAKRGPALPGHTSAPLLHAVYRWLSRSPAPLLGVSLDDLCGETEPLNLPGVPAELHPSWTRRMAVTLEQLPRLPGLPELFAALHERGGRRPRSLEAPPREGLENDGPTEPAGDPRQA